LLIEAQQHLDRLRTQCSDQPLIRRDVESVLELVEGALAALAHTPILDAGTPSQWDDGDFAESVRRGEDLFEREIRPHLKPEDDGKFLVLDLATGAHEIDEDDYTATERLRSKHPDAELYGRRIDVPAVTGVDRSSTELGG
jgi:hypothetical protein